MRASDSEPKMTTAEPTNNEIADWKVREVARNKFSDVALLIFQEQTAKNRTQRKSKKQQKELVSPSSSVLSLQVSPFLSDHLKLSQTKSCNFKETPERARGDGRSYSQSLPDDTDFGTWPRKRTYNVKAYGLQSSPLTGRSKYQRRSRTVYSGSSDGSGLGKDIFREGSEEVSSLSDSPLIPGVLPHITVNASDSTEYPDEPQKSDRIESESEKKTDLEVNGSRELVQEGPQRAQENDGTVDLTVVNEESGPLNVPKDQPDTEDVDLFDCECVCDDPSNNVGLLDTAAFSEEHDDCSKNSGKETFSKDAVVDSGEVIEELSHSCDACVDSNDGIPSPDDRTKVQPLLAAVNSNVNNNNMDNSASISSPSSLKESVKSSFCSAL